VVFDKLDGNDLSIFGLSESTKGCSVFFSGESAHLGAHEVFLWVEGYLIQVHGICCGRLVARYQQFVVPICAGLVSEIHRLHINFSHVCRLAFSFELPFLFADHLQIIQRESVLVRWFKHALGCEVLFVVFPNKDMAALIDR
jgi:hypothetical protein